VLDTLGLWSRPELTGANSRPACAVSHPRCEHRREGGEPLLDDGLDVRKKDAPGEGEPPIGRVSWTPSSIT
jgi:hypothetical protein